MALHDLINTHLDSMSPRPQEILDVGGGAQPHAAATEILDLFDYDFVRQYSCQTDYARLEDQQWTTFDICSRQPWPYGDGEFDFSICAHTMEDLKDPLWVCRELMRVSKTGYIEFPSRFQESIHGLVRRGVTGWPHHRWMIEAIGQTLLFIPKLHHMNGSPRLYLPASFRKQRAASHTSFFWSGRFNAYELLIHVEDYQREYISQFGGRHTYLYDSWRWLRKIIAQRDDSGDPCPSYMWADPSGRQFGPYTCSDDGPWLEPTFP